MIKKLKTSIAVVFLAAACGAANAATVTYDYVGNIINISSLNNTYLFAGNRISASVTFNGSSVADGFYDQDSASISGWAISDGLNVIGNNDPSFGLRLLSISFLGGQVTNWQLASSANIGPGNNYSSISVALNTSSTADSSLIYVLGGPGPNPGYYNFGGSNTNNPGVWTIRDEQIGEVPVPAALPLMASALAFFGISFGRKTLA